MPLLSSRIPLSLLSLVRSPSGGWLSPTGVFFEPRPRPYSSQCNYAPTTYRKCVPCIPVYISPSSCQTSLTFVMVSHARTNILKTRCGVAEIKKLGLSTTCSSDRPEIIITAVREAPRTLLARTHTVQHRLSICQLLTGKKTGHCPFGGMLKRDGRTPFVRGM